jgi:hypothetical protein
MRDTACCARSLLLCRRGIDQPRIQIWPAGSLPSLTM